MNKHNTPDPLLDFLSEKALAALTSTIEERILIQIQKNPEKYFPNISKTENTIYLTTEEVAERLRTTPVTVRNLCHKGKIRFSRPAGRSIMITEDDFKQYQQTTQFNSNE